MKGVATLSCERCITHILCSVMLISPDFGNEDRLLLIWIHVSVQKDETYPQIITTQNKFLHKLRIIIVSTLTVTDFVFLFHKVK